MWLTCPDCGGAFYFEMKYLVMLNESIKRNPKLKIICTKCGIKIMKRYENKRKGGE